MCLGLKDGIYKRTDYAGKNSAQLRIRPLNLYCVWRLVKERKKITEFIIKQSAEITSIIPNEDGTFSILDTQGNLVEHEQNESVGYLRDSGKAKILRSIVRNSDDQLGENPWKKYDKIGFVDTNSTVKGDQKLFICSSSLFLWKDDNRRFANVHCQDLLIGYCTTEVNPERIGWRDFIQRMQASNLLSKSDRMLITVDSEKAAIPSINERSEPVFEDFMLPHGFTIAYATSDSGAESWINKEMKRRDKIAGRAMLKIQGDHGFLDHLAKSGYLYITNSFEQES